VLGGVLLCAAPAGAQQAGPSPAPSATARTGPVEPAAETPQQAAAERARKLALILDPAEYAPAFSVGAQAELVVPSTGASAMLLGYDAVWMQAELSLGFGLGDDVEAELDSPDVYTTAVRLGFPVHRGIRADFSLLAGGGVTWIDPPDGNVEPIASGAVGAKFRVFMTPNLAVAGTLGVIALFRDDHSAVLAGARPLGSAAVVYFFR
jgi:hypothetical protein